LSGLVTEVDFIPTFGGNASIYNNSLWIPTTGAYSNAQKGTVDDVIVLEWDGSSVTTHRVGSPNGDGAEIISWADDDYLFLLETSRGEIWRWDGSSWTYLMRLYNEHTSGNEVRAHVTPVHKTEHNYRVSGYVIAYDNKLWYFESPGRIRKLLEITQPIQSVESWKGGIFYGTKEGGSMGMDQFWLERWGQARAWVRYINAEEFSKLLADRPPHFSDRLWNGESIGAGDSTAVVPCWKYRNKEIMFESDTAGTLTIKGNVYGKTMRDYTTRSIDANSPEFIDIGHALSRVQFSFDTAATVTLEVNFE